MSMSLIINSSMASLAIQQRNETVEQETEAWLQRYFVKKLFMEVAYTEDLFMRIKQHLLAHQYIKNMPHKELKKIVKSKIVTVQQKKHMTQKWISKHKKQINAIIKNYVEQHPAAEQQKIFEYLLHSCKNNMCKQLHQALNSSEFLPELIKQTIKKSINEVQINVIKK